MTTINNVIIALSFNNNYSSLLTEVFKHTEETARDITLQIHEQGSGIAGTYSFEIAEAKAVESTNLARGNGFPLQIKMEEE